MGSEEQFIIALARALQKNGIPAHRLEDTLVQVSQKFNINADFYSNPNSIFISFNDHKTNRTLLEKTKVVDLNLEALHEIDKVTAAVMKDKYDAQKGVELLKEIERLPARYNKLTNVLFFALSTSSAACLFGGGYGAIITSGIIGLVLGLFMEVIKFMPSVGRVFILLAAIIAFVISKSAVLLWGNYGVEIALITGLINLIPGFSFTQSINELANGHPTSGSTRMSNVMITFIMLAFGIGIGSKLMENVVLVPADFSFVSMPFWVRLIALFTVPAGFVVLFKAIPRHFTWMFISCAVSYYAFQYFSSYDLDELTAFLSALTLGVVCNGVSRLTNNPVSLMLVPGMILLVPGSIGFKSVGYFVNEQTLTGIEGLFSMIITAVALAAGLLFSNMIIKPKRML